MVAVLLNKCLHIDASMMKFQRSSCDLYACVQGVQTKLFHIDKKFMIAAQLHRIGMNFFLN